MINRHNLSKSIVARVDIKHGEPIKAEKLDVKSPGIGLSPNRFDEIIGTMAQRSIKKGEFFYDTDLEHLSSAVFENKLSQPIGVPVRYHDHDLLTTKQKTARLLFYFSCRKLFLRPAGTQTSSQQKMT